MERDEELLPVPDIPLALSAIQHFEAIVQDALGKTTGAVIYDVAPYPRSAFLQYLVAHKQFLLHGSNHPDIDIFEPRPQTDYEGRMMTAVFAAEDGVVPVFYAILDRNTYKGSMRNTFQRIKDGSGRMRTHYRFSIDADSLACSPWIEGMIYVFDRNQFTRVYSEDGEPLLEWTCPQPIRPVMRVRVTPNDFLYLKNVVGHDGRLGILAYRLFTSYEQVEELDDGFAFGYRWTHDWATDVVIFIELLRSDTPLAQIELVCEPNDGLVWLRLYGSEEIKATIKLTLQQIGDGRSIGRT